jgi:hypothetical protein
MSVRLSLAALLLSFAALLAALGVLPVSAHPELAPAAVSLTPAPAGETGGLYIVNHGNWG